MPLDAAIQKLPLVRLTPVAESRPLDPRTRLLLEAPDVMAAVPEVLRRIGEAASVDRVNVLLAQIGPNGERPVARIQQRVSTDPARVSPKMLHRPRCTAPLPGSDESDRARFATCGQVCQRGGRGVTPHVQKLPVLVVNPHSLCNCRCAMCDIWKRKNLQEISAAQFDRQLAQMHTPDNPEVAAEFNNLRTLVHASCESESLGLLVCVF